MSRTAFSRFLTAVAALLLAVAGVAPGDAGAQVGPDARARIDSVFADVDRSGSPGCAVGVTVRGRLEVAKGYGLATLDYRRPLTPTSVFPIASMSKQFTAAAAVIAARRGLFSLDDPVRRWVPDLPEYDAGPITLRHLVHHTSGLRDNYNLGYLAGWDNLDAHDTEEYLELVYRQQGLNFAPGTDNAYSNTNYLLLAEAVAEASGTSYRQFVHDAIFDPLEMDDTHVHDDRNEVVRGRAVGYRKTESGFAMNHPWDYQIVGPGSVHSTVEDLARWTRNFETEDVGGEGFAEQMATRGRLASGDTLGYAFGLRVGTYRGRRSVEHGGALEGLRTQYVRFPEDDRSVIVLCNRRVDARKRADAVADIVLPGPLEPRAGGGAPAPAAVDRPAEALRRHAGLYRAAEDGYFRFFVKDGRLMAERSRAFQIPLRPVAPGRFTAPGPIDSLVFRRDGAPADTSATVRVYRSTGATSFERTARTSYAPAERRAFEGRYRSPELRATYRVRRAGDGLVLVRPGGREVRLQPAARDEFQIDGGYVRFERSDAGDVAAFVLVTRRVAGLRFERQ